MIFRRKKAPLSFVTYFSYFPVGPSFCCYIFFLFHLRKLINSWSVCSYKSIVSIVKLNASSTVLYESLKVNNIAIRSLRQYFDCATLPLVLSYLWFPFNLNIWDLIRSVTCSFVRHVYTCNWRCILPFIQRYFHSDFFLLFVSSSCFFRVFCYIKIISCRTTSNRTQII